jgi:hypothetical protein
MSSLCRSGRKMVDRADKWRAAMVEKGWEDEPSDPNSWCPMNHLQQRSPADRQCTFPR